MKKILRFQLNLIEQNFTFFALIISTSVTLIVLAFQNTNIGFLQLHSIDEYTFHGSVRHMLSSLMSGKISGLFGYGFYQYGFVFFFINMILAAPGILLQYTSEAIFAPRLFTALSAVFSLLFIYKFSRIFLDKKTASLFTVIFITLPAFWYNATWFHPDWLMTCFVLGTIYFFAKDNFSYKRNFWWGVIFYALAVTVKYQAITVFPLLGLYVFYDSIVKLRPVELWGQTKIFILSIISIIAVFLFGNPYIIHPMGRMAFWSSFKLNMLSNADNHGSAVNVSIIDKVNLAIGNYYTNVIFFFILNLAVLTLVSRIFKTKERNIFLIIACNYFINLAYLFLFVNKAWQIYYLPIIVTGILCLIYFIKNLPQKNQLKVVGIIVIIQFTTYLTSYIPLLTTSRDSTAPDYITYDQDEQIKMNEFIIDSLKPTVTNDSIVLLSAYTPFDYEKLGLPYENVKIIYGALDEGSFSLEKYLVGQRAYWGNLKSDAELATSFKPVDFIILRKDIPYIDTSKLAAIRDTTSYLKANEIVKGLYNKNYEYSLLKEDQTVVIFGLNKNIK